MSKYIYIYRTKKGYITDLPGPFASAQPPSAVVIRGNACWGTVSQLYVGIAQG